MTRDTNVVWVLPGKLGGVLNLVGSLLAHRRPGAPAHHVLLTRNTLETDTVFSGRLPADTQRVVEYRLPLENIHAVVRRLRAALPTGDGVLVANDLIELATASAFDTGRMVLQILHGDYDFYYDLAARHEPVVDVFAAPTRGIVERLRARLPARAADIHHLPHGVDVPARGRESAAGGDLRLIFVGRLVRGKGIFDLPLIDAALRDGGVGVSWTIVGEGQDGEALRAGWRPSHVRWTGVLAPREVLTLYPQHDVFVLPSRAEGLPVTLLESMAAGLVPVVSRLATGIGEVVEAGVTGLLPPVGDVAGFAAAIRTLAADRPRLDAMGLAARARVTADFDIRDRVRGYEDLLARHRELRRPRPAGMQMPYGSRLDRPWIPNAAVKAVRRAVRLAHGKGV